MAYDLVLRDPERFCGLIALSSWYPDLVSQNDPETFLAVDEAIRRLEEVDQRAGSIVRLRLFAGLGVAETAQALELPQRTVERDWAYARSFLFEKLQ